MNEPTSSLPPTPRPTSRPPVAVGYEASDAHPPIIAAVAGLIALGIAGSLAVAGWLYRDVAAVRGSEKPRQTSFANGPSEQSSITQDWVALDSQTDARLHRYGWIDRSKGVVHIPIERAMTLMSAEAVQPKRGTSPASSP
jgi:hypothetical protein